LQRAAHAVAWGKFVNVGQTCVAPDYALVQEGQRQPFLDGLRAAIEQSYGRSRAGPPTPSWPGSSIPARSPG
jgi:aldehyde dehydrogenase (NAD+)